MHKFSPGTIPNPYQWTNPIKINIFFGKKSHVYMRWELKRVNPPSPKFFLQTDSRLKPETISSKRVDFQPPISIPILRFHPPPWGWEGSWNNLLINYIYCIYLFTFVFLFVSHIYLLWSFYSDKNHMKIWRQYIFFSLQFFSSKWEYFC